MEIREDGSPHLFLPCLQCAGPDTTPSFHLKFLFGGFSPTSQALFQISELPSHGQF